MSVNSKYIITTIKGETPSGNIDGINSDFEIEFSPLEGTVEVILNGLVQSEGSGLDYTITGKIITFTKTPKIGSLILVNYSA